MSNITYLASPYSSPDPTVRHARYVSACKCTAALIAKGIMAFSPIAHSHPLVVEGGCTETGFDFWRDFDLTMLSLCSAAYVLCIDGWRDSNGLWQELGAATALGLPIRCVNEQGEFIETPPQMKIVKEDGANLVP